MFFKSKINVILICALLVITSIGFGIHQSVAGEELVGIDVSDKVRHKKIVAGDTSILTLKDDGTVWGISYNPLNDIIPEDYKADTLIKVEGLENIIDLAADGIHLALDKEGYVWQFTEKGNAFTAPKKVKNIDNVVAIFADSYTAVAIKRDGTVWVFWGEKEKKYGYNFEGIILKPKKLKGVEGIVDVATDMFDTILLDYNGNIYGLLKGVGIKLNGIDNVKGIYHEGVLKEDGTLWKIRRKDIEIDDISDRFYLKKIEGLENIVKVDNYIYTIALDDKGNVWYADMIGKDILNIDKDVVVYEWCYGQSSLLYEFEFKERSIILNDALDVAKGGGNIAYIKKDGTVWYVGESFDPVTEYDKNNIDLKFPDYVRERDDFDEFGVEVLKIQNVPKQLKSEDGSEFNIH